MVQLSCRVSASKICKDFSLAFAKKERTSTFPFDLWKRHSQYKAVGVTAAATSRKGWLR